MNQVILDIEDYDRLKAYDTAAENNYDIKISKGGYHVIYVLKNESATIQSLKQEILELQEQIKKNNKHTWPKFQREWKKFI